jgi:drug/metabolite transporter (DMT)-like permease
VLVGFGLYGVGSVLWILALAKLPLTRVYPFTILTFVLVYMASATVLGEQITGMVLAGAVIVLLGLVLIVLA